MNPPDLPISETLQPMDVTSSGAAVPNPMDESAKRAALAGQWRTPPTAFFASGGVGLEEHTPVPSQPPPTLKDQIKVEDLIKVEEQDPIPVAPTVVAPAAVAAPPVAPTSAVPMAVTVPPTLLAVPPTLPHSAEDYAKALQEAYQRGAEAAARAAAAQQMATVSAPPPEPDVVVPTMQPMLAAPTPLLTASAATSVATTTAAAPALVQMVHHQHAPPPMPATMPASTAASTAAAVPSPALAVATTTVLPPLAMAPPNNAVGAAGAAAPSAATSTAAAAAAAARSVSLPDMSSYAVQQEEEKRQKRLARNRASARLRRLRKKNLVDAYESEVGSLEKTIQQLQQHEWGATQAAPALADALSMDRGQQKLTSAERYQAATDILAQQLQFLQQLEDLMQEQYVLQQMAACSLSGDVANESEWKDLQDLLQLTPEQCQALVQNSTGWQDEWNALQTVKSSLQAMKENNWLWNEGCSAITDQFMSILHKNQISKFLLWTDHNAETIEELDGVHAIDTVQDSPVFSFGVDSSPHEMLDDEKTS